MVIGFSYLYKSLVIIESGLNAKEHPVHKELLCSLSSAVNSLFRDGDLKAGEYQQASVLQDNINYLLDEDTINAEKVLIILNSFPSAS